MPRQRSHIGHDQGRIVRQQDAKHSIINEALEGRDAAATLQNMTICGGTSLLEGRNRLRVTEEISGLPT